MCALGLGLGLIASGAASQPLLGAAHSPAAPGASAWFDFGQARARLVAARSGHDGPAEIGVHIRLAPGWKTYWRVPGEAGLAPEFDWSASENLGEVSLRWPAPRRSEISGIDSFVYLDEVVFPVTAKPADANRPLHLRLKLRFGVCKDICIPADAELALVLPAGGGEPTAFAPLIARFAASVPQPAAALGIGFDPPIARPQPPALEIVVRAAVPFDAPDLLVEGPAELWFGRPAVTLLDGRRVARLVVPVYPASKAALLAGAALTLTLIDGTRAVEVRSHARR